MSYLLIIIIVIGFLLISYWGIPYLPLKKAGYQQPDINSLSEKVQPVEITGKNKIGILLIHGFEGSPFEMKELGDYLYSLGYTISIPLLPGHGTSAEDLVKTDFSDWYFHIEKEYIKLKLNCHHIYAIGISLGGLLALKLAERHELNALITISSPVFFNRLYNGKWIMTDFRLFFSGLLSVLFKKVEIQRKGNSDICPWEGYDNYLAINCAHSIKRNIPIIRNNLFKINSPICLIHALNDHTIPIENSYYIYQSVSSIEKRAFSFYIPNELSTNHVLTTHAIVKNRVFSYILQFIKDCESNFQLNPKKMLGIKGFFKHYFRKINNTVKKLF